MGWGGVVWGVGLRFLAMPYFAVPPYGQNTVSSLQARYGSYQVPVIFHTLHSYGQIRSQVVFTSLYISHIPVSWCDLSLPKDLLHIRYTWVSWFMLLYVYILIVFEPENLLCV